jgi:hypothetical protein
MVPAPSRPGSVSGFVPTHRRFVSYIDKSREYYAAHGYEKSFQWATNDDTPFTPLDKPLAECRVGLVTTSFLYREDRPAEWPDGKSKHPYALAVERAPERMYTADLSWDKQATHTDDRESFLPLRRCQELVSSGRVGSLSPRFYGVPTDYSIRRTLKVDAPAMLEFMRQDDVDVALLIPL